MPKLKPCPFCGLSRNLEHDALSHTAWKCGTYLRAFNGEPCQSGTCKLTSKARRQGHLEACLELEKNNWGGGSGWELTGHQDIASALRRRLARRRKG